MEISWFLITQYGGHPLHDLWEELQNKTSTSIFLMSIAAKGSLAMNVEKK